MSGLVQIVPECNEKVRTRQSRIHISIKWCYLQYTLASDGRR